MRGFWGTDDQISILNPEAEFRIQFSMSKEIKGNEGGATNLRLFASTSPLLREWGSGGFLSSWRLVIERFESVNVLPKKQNYSTSLGAFAIKQAP